MKKVLFVNEDVLNNHIHLGVVEELAITIVSRKAEKLRNEYIKKSNKAQDAYNALRDELNKYNEDERFYEEDSFAGWHYGEQEFFIDIHVLEDKKR